MLGREICLELKKAEISFVGTDKEIDITSHVAVKSFISSQKPRWVVNCAAYTAVDKAEVEEDLVEKINADGPCNLARAANELDASLIHFSTDYIFDGDSPLPYKEEDKPHPVSAYGRSKLLGEKLIQEETNKFFIFRISWLYGIWGPNFVKTICRLLKEKPQLKVVADQNGAPTFAHSLAQNIVELLNSECNSRFGIYHYSDEGNITWYEFALEIKKLALEFGFLHHDVPIIPITTREYPVPAKRPKNSAFNKSKVKELLHFKCTNWETNLREYFQELNHGEKHANV